MALETATPPATPSAQVVGHAFVEQYYHILCNSPELAHRFYHDSSVLSRPDSNGVMTSVTTMQGINEKILSLDYPNHKTEINTADAQKSYKEGVTVLVTGCQTGKDNLKRKFAQSFFLAPQDNGYFVLNDVFRYVEDGEPLENHKVNGVNDAPRVPSTPESEPTQVLDPSAPDPATALVEENQNVAEHVDEPSGQERQLVNEKEAVSESQSHSNGNDISIVVESTSSSAQEDTPKKSYASIVKVPKGGSGPTRVYVPTNTPRVTPKKAENQSPVSAATAPPEASLPTSVDAPESNNIPEEVEGHSIYIRNLPFNVTPIQLEQEFNKFGPIKQGGVQVRNNKQQGYCFGFVEFLSLSSMNDAIQASPIAIGDRQAVVEIKRTSTRVGSGRGSFPSRRGGFRSDSFRGRGNYGGSRSFGRNEYGNRGEFSARARGSAGREGRGRGGRSSGPKQTSAST
ncbi:Nuclear transport factor 2 family protein with RNA binding domain isoform 1 [Theobroma cacao]|uniref:Nuclear transport factor 2 family protein with RNA binding domain isoform 1 n=1 Tax=Theobroma cacao TaxID=3641 RepID=A0A061EN12_THECC|nr:Nuclear transport factor 2 family protein with RNA binding domain isoform 1 [Theobroma cacao]EOY03688.1 Nuclear transport factor 2 family protein with RNA binding domain isoform 1 [Theobroma cacao]EOY03689.1 Nuclear transport factor 2 family protein with RNA binding domain isoform 1 [Theobroma cacao]